jgi:hypothetical protein
MADQYAYRIQTVGEIYERAAEGPGLSALYPDTSSDPAARSLRDPGNGCLPSGPQVVIDPMMLLKIINGKVVPTRAVVQGLAEAESWGISCKERARSFKDQRTWKGIGSNPSDSGYDEPSVSEP